MRRDVQYENNKCDLTISLHLVPNLYNYYRNYDLLRYKTDRSIVDVFEYFNVKYCFSTDCCTEWSKQHGQDICSK